MTDANAKFFVMELRLYPNVFVNVEEHTKKPIEK